MLIYTIIEVFQVLQDLDDSSLRSVDILHHFIVSASLVFIHFRILILFKRSIIVVIIIMLHNFWLANNQTEALAIKYDLLYAMVPLTAA